MSEAVVNRRRAAISNLVFPWISAVLNIVNGIALVPLYLRHFDLATYGGWLASGNVLTLLSTLDLGLNVVLWQRLAAAAGARDDDSFARLTGAGMAITLGSSGAIALAGLGVASRVPVWINAPPASVHAIGAAFALAAVGSALSLAYQSVALIGQAWQRTAPAGWINLLGLGTQIIITTLALKFGRGVVSIGIGVFARGLVGLTALGFDVRSEWMRRRLPPPKLSRRDLIDLARTTTPLFASRLASVFLSNSEAAIVSIAISPSAAAVLGLTSRVFTQLSVFISPLASAPFAGIVHLDAEGKRVRVREVIREVFGWISLATSCLLCSAVALNGSFIRLWVGEGRFGGIRLSLAVCLSVLVTMRASSLALMVSALGEIRRTTFTGVVEVVVRIALLYTLVRIFGLIGLPLSAMFSALLVSSTYLVLLLGQRLGVGFGGGLSIFGEGLHLVAVTMFVGIAWSVLVPQPRSWGAFALQGVVVSVVIGALTILGSSFGRTKARAVFARGWQRRGGGQ